MDASVFSRFIGIRRAGTRGGFTLVELIVVIILVAVMAGVAVPSTCSIQNSRSGIAARQILRDVTFARQRALATGVRSWVVVNTGAKTWSILAENPNAPGRAGAAILSDPATGQSYTTTLGIGEYQGVNFASCDFDGQTEVGFDWLGEPLNAGENPLASQGAIVLSGNYQVLVAPGAGHTTFIKP